MFLNNFSTEETLNIVIAIVYFIQILYDRQLIKAYREFIIFV